MKVWTLRLEGRRKPFLWLTDEGLDSLRTIKRTLERVTEQGETVIVGLTTHRPRKEIEHG
jgi:hypothetical protein